MNNENNDNNNKKNIKYSDLTEEQRLKRNEASKKNYRTNRYKRLAYQKEYNEKQRAKNVEYQHDYFKKKQQISKYNKAYYNSKITNNKPAKEEESIFTVFF